MAVVVAEMTMSRVVVGAVPERGRGMTRQGRMEYRYLSIASQGMLV